MTPRDWSRVKDITRDPSHPLHSRFWKDGVFHAYGAWPGARKARVKAESKRWKSPTHRVEHWA